MIDLKWLANAFVFALITLSAIVYAGEYPERPVKIVVPYSPGGPADLFARVVANKLTTTFGKNFFLENRPGAGLVIGAQYVANSTPDGYTLLLAASSMLVPTAARGRTPNDNLTDFFCVSLIGNLPMVLIVNVSIPVRNVKELIDYTKKRPNEINYASSGNGSLTHIAGALFDFHAGLKMVHVPYRGINEALTDLIANQIQLSFAGAPIALPNAKSGKVRALAVTSANRSLSAPELPTIAESGMTGYDVTPWYGIVAPVATPIDIINTLHREIVHSMQGADIKERWTQWSGDPVYSKTPAEFSALMKSETEKWAKLLKQTGLKLE